MSNKTNDDRLKILQERLKQLKERDEESNNVNHSSSIQEKEKENQNKIDSKKQEAPNWELEKKEKKSSRWIIYVVLFGIIALAQQYFQWDLFKKDIVIDTEKIINESTEKIENIVYNIDFNSEFIAIIDEFKNESSAKALVNNLTVQGYKCSYFFLPNKSNSKQEIYNVYIGPYENKLELKQWCNNIDNKDIKIIN